MMQTRKLTVGIRSALLCAVGAACGLAGNDLYAQTATPDTTAAPVASAAPDAAAASADAKKNATNLNAIQVTGQLESLLRAQETKRDDIGVVDSVSAAEAGQFPDQNVADALQRVPGVSVNRGGGESSQITVRGFGPQFVNVLVNGRDMASSSTDRAFDFDVLPVELLQQAVVHKTGTADLDEGGIGGTVNLVTAQPFDFNGFHASTSVGGVNDDSVGGKVTPKVSGIIGNTNADHTFGWLVSAVYYKRDHSTESVDTSGWMHMGFPWVNPNYTDVYLPQSLQGSVTHEKRTRQALSGAIDWKPIDDLTVKVDGLYSEYKVDYSYNAFGLYTNPYVIDSITPGANNTAQSFSENATGGMSNDYIKEGNPRDSKNLQFGINLNYQIDKDTQVDFDSSVSRAWNKQSANGYFVVIGTRNLGVNPAWTNNGNSQLPSYTDFLSPTDVNNLHAHVTNEGTQSPNVSNDIFENRLHLSHTFQEGVLSRLDFGVEQSSQDKTMDTYNTPNSFGCAEYCGYVATIPASAIGAHVGNFGSLVGGVSPGFPQQWIDYDVNKLFAYLATPAAYNQLPNAAAFKAQLDANGGSFGAIPDPQKYSRIHEIVRAAYAMGTLDGNMGEMPWELNLGMRYTKTDTTSEAYSVPLVSLVVNPNDPTNAIPTYGAISPISAHGSYSNWLPSANFRLNLRDDLIFRAAASKTLTRPDLSNLSAAVGYDFRPTDQTITKGNAELKPYVSKNFDMGLEWYFADTSYVALDGFYKKVDNFSTLVTSTTELLGFPFLLTEPVNLNSASIKGAEFTFNYQFTHLPSPFDGLGVATNYTYVTSSASASGTEISTTGKFAIPGIGNSSNASLFYTKGPIELRLAYNWRQAYLSSIAGAQGQPTTVKAYGQLDFSGNYHLNKNVSFYLQATNLNNEKIYQYQVYLDRESYAEADGRTISAGVHIDWN